jgi:hypothetical protein
MLPPSASLLSLQPDFDAPLSSLVLIWDILCSSLEMRLVPSIPEKGATSPAIVCSFLPALPISLPAAYSSSLISSST